ncbi:MAG: hypothetical protein ABMA14_12810 [Hyphomonadaceae bacterium]
MVNTMQGRPARRAASLLVLAAGLAPVAFAQGTAAPTPTPVEAKSGDAKAAEGVQVFEAGYFKQFNPVTAADIVNRVPGFDIDDGEVLRGFGATAGNVLSMASGHRRKC